MKAPDYKNKKLRIGAALVASVYIVFHGRPLNLVKAFTSPGFYIAVITSFAISLILVYAVHRITAYLDRRYDWRSGPVQRSVMQFVFGIVLPALTDVILISVYFELLGQNIFDNGFLLIDFPVIVAFIILLNLYYVIHYLLLTEPKEAEAKENDPYIKQPENNTSRLNVDYHSQHLQFDVPEDVLCFYRSGKIVMAFTVHGNEYEVNSSLSDLEERFRPLDFLRINRSLIINGRTIRGYENSEKKYSFKIILKPQYRDLIDSSKVSLLYVTKEYFAIFREQFSKL